EGVAPMAGFGGTAGRWMGGVRRVGVPGSHEGRPGGLRASGVVAGRYGERNAATSPRLKPQIGVSLLTRAESRVYSRTRGIELRCTSVVISILDVNSTESRPLVRG